MSPLKRWQPRDSHSYEVIRPSDGPSEHLLRIAHEDGEAQVRIQAL